MHAAWAFRWSLLAVFVVALIVPGLISESQDLPATLQQRLAFGLAVFCVVAHHIGLFYLCETVVARLKLAKWWLVRVLAYAALAMLLVPAVWLAVFPLAFVLGLFGRLVPATEASSVIYWVISFMEDMALKSLLTSAVFVCPLAVAILTVLPGGALTTPSSGRLSAPLKSNVRRLHNQPSRKAMNRDHQTL